MIYFIQAGLVDLIKIGWSKHPKKRLKELQTGCPYPLTLLFVLKNKERSDETKLHQEFRHLKFRNIHLKGEWFIPDPKILSLNQEVPNLHQLWKDHWDKLGVGYEYLPDITFFCDGLYWQPDFIKDGEYIFIYEENPPSLNYPNTKIILGKPNQ